MSKRKSQSPKSGSSHAVNGGDTDECLRSPLRYPGGTSRVAKIICSYIPPHEEYREIFFGGGAVFFHKPKAKQNWINDLHPGLHALLLAVRDHFEEFADLCRAQDTRDLRATFKYWIGRRDLMEATGEDHLVERAVQYSFINRTVFNGRVIYDPARRSRLVFSNPRGWGNLEKKLKHLRACSEKLQGVKITCLPFEHCLGDATKDTFVYCDPPYYRDTIAPPPTGSMSTTSRSSSTNSSATSWPPRRPRS